MLMFERTAEARSERMQVECQIAGLCLCVTYSVTNYFAETLSTKELRGSAWLFGVVIRSLASDDHVVNVALAQAGVRNPNEAALAMKLLDAAAPEITHA